MKTWIALAVGAVLAVGATVPVMRSTAPKPTAQAAPQPAAPIVAPAPTPVPALAAAPDPSSARHYELHIIQAMPEGVLAKAVCYDWKPDEVIPRGVTGSIDVPIIQTKWNGEQHLIYVAGVIGKVDGEDWEGMLEPVGIYRYTAALGIQKSVHSFRVSKARDPVAAYWNEVRSTSAR